MDFEQSVRHRRWTPLSEFGPSIALAPLIFARGDGSYLRTNPRFGQGDPVLSVAWAESDYWALRSWAVPFEGELTPTRPRFRPTPSLAFAGRPEELRFGTLRSFEAGQPGARSATLLHASYRMTDGAHMSTQISGTDGITYYFGQVNPDDSDEPVMIEFKLPE